MVCNQRKTIFVVDDDVTNLTVGKSALSGHYDVFTLNSGARLLKMLENKLPDLILLDINMPEMDGYETIGLLKENARTAQVPVIFLTALDSEEVEYKGLSLGAIDYITKPFSPALLLKRIEVHLLVESQRQELVKYNKNLEHMVEEKVKTVIELKNVVLKTMAELVEYRDEETGGHIDRTQGYVKALIDALHENKHYLDDMADWDEHLVVQSSQLHDVGKIFIRDDILLKPGKLTPEEFENMKTHTTLGANVIQTLIESTSDSAFLAHAQRFAVAHHEKWDGSGYPCGLAGENIPLEGRLMAIADVYDALTTMRPYKSAFSHDTAKSIIAEGRGAHFDPILTDMFLLNEKLFEEIAIKFASTETH